jgi:protein N-terminal amidase
MRIACLQFDPKLGKPAANRARAEALLRRAPLGSLDVLLLPEMAFSGYCFKSRDEILPFCEDAHDGPTAEWCRRIARQLACHVVCGFPERTAEEILYNSLLVADSRGEIVHVYRKHFLYMTDESWAAEGPAFSCVDIAGLGRCAFAICMDLNPYKFKAPSDRFEFASSLFEPPLEHHEHPAAGTHALKADLILSCNNWLRNPLDLSLGDAEHTRWLLNYWAYRLLPALSQPVIFAVANRVGRERKTLFAGASCVIDLGTRTVLGHLDGRSEDVLIVDVPLVV